MRHGMKVRSYSNEHQISAENITFHRFLQNATPENGSNLVFYWAADYDPTFAWTLELLMDKIHLNSSHNKL